MVCISRMVHTTFAMVKRSTGGRCGLLGRYHRRAGEQPRRLVSDLVVDDHLEAAGNHHRDCVEVPAAALQGVHHQAQYRADNCTDDQPLERQHDAGHQRANQVEQSEYPADQCTGQRTGCRPLQRGAAVVQPAGHLLDHP